MSFRDVNGKLALSDMMNEEGKRLAEVIRRTHKKLRKHYKLGEDESKVWKEHVQHEEKLQTYASAMYKLATQHWESRQKVNSSRVTWVHDAIMQYFHKGEMQRITEKEMRKLDHLGLKVNDDLDRYKVSLTSRIRMLDVGSCYNPFSVYKEFNVTAVDLCPAHLSVRKCDFLSLEVSMGKPDSDPLEAFDCDNPKVSVQSRKSKAVNEIQSAVLDISQTTKLRTSVPSATPHAAGKLESVLVPTLEEKDKTKVPITDTSELTTTAQSLSRNTSNSLRINAKVLNKPKFSKEINENMVDSFIPSEISSRTVFERNPGSDTIKFLEGNSFDVVVFCLLLEYIPSPKQRFACCQKAYHLLRPNGILCIITPDSKHQNANVHIYKLWKITLGYLGFTRTKYEKLTHFHGMVFRKGLCKEAWVLDAIRQLSLMKMTNVRNKFVGIDYEKVKSEVYIPQDFQDLTESEEMPDDE